MLKVSKLMLLCFAFVLTTFFVSGCGQQSGSKDGAKVGDFINIATGGTAGTYYPIGGAIAEILNKEGLRSSAQSTGASVANINMLQEGSVDLAIVQNDVAFYAINGTEMFKDKKIENLQAIASLYPETCQIVTLESSGINSIADFRGKKVAVGAQGSGVEANARQILMAYGIDYSDIDVRYLSLGEAAIALKNGSIDVAFVTAGYPTAAVQDIASQQKVKLISIDNDKANELIKEFPFYTKTKIPAGTYSGIDTETSTVSVMAMLITTDRVNEELGEKITKSIFSNLDTLKSSHAAAQMISQENAMNGISIKMNSGADKFFKQ